MSSSYGRTEQRGGGITKEEWLKNYLAMVNLSGPNAVTVRGVDSNGNPTYIPKGVAGLLFGTLKKVRQENRSNHKGTAPIVTGTPLGVVNLKEALEALLLGTHHSLIEKGMLCCVVPLFISSTERTSFCNAVTGQCLATWIGAGDQYSINPDQKINGIAFMQVIDTLAMRVANAETKDELKLMLTYLCLVLKAAESNFKCFPDSFKVVEPLRNDIDTINNLQRALAFVFLEPEDGEPQFNRDGTPWYIKDFLHMFCKSFKKYIKWAPGNEEVNIIKRPIFGIMVIMFVPVLRDLIKGDLSIDQAVELYTEYSFNMVKVSVDNIKSTVTESNITFLHELWNQSKCLKKYSREMFANLYKHCVDKKNIDTPTPLEDWGFIPPLVVPFVFTTNTKVHGKKHPIQSVVTACGDSFKVVSTNGAEWAGLNLTTPGVFTFICKLVANASEGKGNTIGKNDNANVRFTTGDSVLGGKEDGVSSAGMKHDARRMQKYTPIGKTLPLTKFTLVIKDNSFDILDDKGNLFHTFPRNPNLPVVVGFKFCNFLLSYKKHEVVEQVVEQEVVQIEGVNDNIVQVVEEAEKDPFDGLTGVALLKALQKLALEDQKGKQGSNAKKDPKRQAPPAYE